MIIRNNNSQERWHGFLDALSMSYLSLNKTFTILKPNLQGCFDAVRQIIVVDYRGNIKLKTVMCHTILLLLCKIY